MLCSFVNLKRICFLNNMCTYEVNSFCKSIICVTRVRSDLLLPERESCPHETKLSASNSRKRQWHFGHALHIRFSSYHYFNDVLGCGAGRVYVGDIIIYQEFTQRDLGTTGMGYRWPGGLGGRITPQLEMLSLCLTGKL